MKFVTKVQTADGQLHENHIKAGEHAERVYGLALCKLAAKLVALDWKYTATAEFIDAHLDAFTELARLKADIVLEKTDDED